MVDVERLLVLHDVEASRLGVAHDAAQEQLGRPQAVGLHVVVDAIGDALHQFNRGPETHRHMLVHGLPLDEIVDKAILDEAEAKALSRGHTRALVAVLRNARVPLREFIRGQPVGGPHRVVIGERGLEAGVLEYRHRRAENNEEMPLAEAVAFLKARMG